MADAKPFHWEYNPEPVAREVFRVEGGHALSGVVPISGAKNAALKMLAAATLTGERCCEVDGIGRAGRLERPFRLASGFLRLLEVDVAREVGRLRHHHDPIRPDLQEPAHDRERLLRPALPDPKLADPEHRNQRGMVGQHPKLALTPRQLHRIDSVRISQPLRRDDLKQEWHRSTSRRRSAGTVRRSLRRCA